MNNIYYYIIPQTRVQVWDQVKNRVADTVWVQVGDQVWSYVVEQLRRSIWRAKIELKANYIT